MRWSDRETAANSVQGICENLWCLSLPCPLSISKWIYGAVRFWADWRRCLWQSLRHPTPPSGFEDQRQLCTWRNKRNTGAVQTHLCHSHLIYRVIYVQVTELPADYVYVGTTDLQLEDIHRFNSEQSVDYELHKNDCRYLCQKYTSMDADGGHCVPQPDTTSTS